MSRPKKLTPTCDYRMTLWLTEDQFDFISAQADSFGYTAGEYIRALIDSYRFNLSGGYYEDSQTDSNNIL